MRKETGLGLFVLLALVGTACGKTPSEAAKQDALPKQEVQTPVAEDKKPEAEPKSQEAADAKKTADTKPAAQDTAGTNSANATSAGNSSSSAGSTGTGASNGSTGNSGTGTGASSNGSAGSGGSGASGGSKTSGGTPSGQYELSVTEYFGSNTVFDQPVAMSSEQTLLDTMRDHLDVETAYGGSFVNGINGTKSGYTNKSIFTRKKRDWFYYVNGTVAQVGADAVKPKAGDSVWWDYHDWAGDGSSTPCVVASYPHPFTTGYNGAQPGTTIYYSGNHASDADRLANALRGFGAGNVQTAAYADGNVAHPSQNVIVLGTWSELGNQAAVQTLFGSPTHTGLYAKFSANSVQLLTYQGKSTDQTGQAAILAAGSNGGASTTPTWLVIGATEAGLDQAIDIMTTSPGKLHGKIGVVVNSGNALAVPVAE
ncbi:DUF4430 domain-containing protein [Tumebacillus flagellatus]|uniref:Transcobalamin-like C-terminal domain-containing protein n=1 Tax=Tumebacillus flagellatus TaxID=1157490 RepID=A0A074LQV2_9BACL|nr:DUF4430 domain-containing protein [Tumebacillus flagellatus]KEO84506.1 hypothetical protein EL26_03015 [Tumebacillus flagellatus]